MDSLTFRIIAEQDEINTALEIARKNTHFFNRNGLATMKKDLESDISIGAFDQKRMIGFISLKELNKDVIEISWMAVDPQFQNKGIGTQLFCEGLQLISPKYKICEVKTLSETDPDLLYAKTRSFYKKLGFIPLETINPYPRWGKDNPCQMFIKIL